MMLAFAQPVLLWGLVALPLLWLLLRAVPPAPIRRRFPGVALLLGLRDEDRQADRTPWWLLLLRLLAIAAVIVGFAGPVLNPSAQVASDRPLLMLVDGGWADAYDWPLRLAKVQDLLDGAERAGRPVALVQLTEPPQDITFRAAAELRGTLAAMVPRNWLPDQQDRWVPNLPEGPFDTAWLSDDLAHRGRADLVAAVQGRGVVTVHTSAKPVYALGPVTVAEGKLTLTALRLPAGPAQQIEVLALGPDPTGTDRELARAPMTFDDGAPKATAEIDLPPELRNRVTRFALAGLRSAGAVNLAGDALHRRKVALIADTSEGEGERLLAPLHYVRQALAPTVDLIEGGVEDVLPANPDVIVLADIVQMPLAQTERLMAWVEKGGLLLRFAGPRMAAADMQRLQDDPLMPVRLRAGGRTVGEAMSWDDPKAVAPFAEASVFHGLAVPPDLRIATQVLAEPDPELATRTLALLEDGTPLVTRRTIGQGQVVLFHVSANAEWSNLPLSGLFVQMLDRLAVSVQFGAVAGADAVVGLTWAPERLMDGWGALGDPGGLAGVAGAQLLAGMQQGPQADVPAGLYRSNARLLALNPVPAGLTLVQADWPLAVIKADLSPPTEQSLKGAALAVALMLLSGDILAALLVSGRLGRLAAAVGLALMVLQAPQAQAQTADEAAIVATEGVVLAYVETGDAQVDAVSMAGLVGLGDQLWARTAVEPMAPVAVDIETDELAFFPFLYWPVTADAALPSAAAYAKVNRFLRTGGMILFDTRDGDVAGAGGASAEAQALQRLASGLDIPPLEPLPQDHVLTRTFYLLAEFPGRFAGGGVWVEAAPPDAALAEGMPFRNLNDGVTPVVIGGNDWASAWAVDDNGFAMFPVGRGAAGEKQREYANRFGVNLIMYVLTGNYKSDQVHVPALLERLGQ